MKILITGGNGRIGSFLSKRLAEIADVCPIRLSGLQGFSNKDLRANLDTQLEASLSNREDHVGIIFCHRSRLDSGPSSEVSSRELAILSSILEGTLGREITTASVVIVGSITGRKFKRGASENYHMEKLVQASFAQYHGLNDPRVSCNFIELGHISFAAIETQNEVSNEIRDFMKGRSLPSLENLFDLVFLLVQANPGITCQTITLDNGYSRIQPH